MKIVTETRQEKENRSKEEENRSEKTRARRWHSQLTEVRKSLGVVFDSALELIIRTLAPNILKTVGLKS